MRGYADDAAAGPVPSVPGTVLLAAVACAGFEFAGGVALVALARTGRLTTSAQVLVPATFVLLLAAAAIAGVLVESRLRTLGWRTPRQRAVLAAGVVVMVQALFVAGGGWRAGALGTAGGFVATAVGAVVGGALVRRRVARASR
jgi:hypothetical protein